MCVVSLKHTTLFFFHMGFALHDGHFMWEVSLTCPLQVSFCREFLLYAPCWLLENEKKTVIVNSIMPQQSVTLFCLFVCCCFLSCFCLFLVCLFCLSTKRKALNWRRSDLGSWVVTPGWIKVKTLPQLFAIYHSK